MHTSITLLFFNPLKDLSFVEDSSEVLAQVTRFVNSWCNFDESEDVELVSDVESVCDDFEDLLPKKRKVKLLKKA